MKTDKIQSAGFGNWVGAASILFMLVAVYWPVFRSDFVWDDNSMLTDNPFVMAGDGIRSIWFSTGPVDYFPLTYTSLWLEWRLWGMDAAGYHVTNLFLHAVSAVLLWRILRQLNLPGAWLAALSFGIHPVAVESVAWIAERKNTLCMFFYLLSLLCFLRSEDKNAPTPYFWFTRPIFQYVLSLIFFLLALLSKTAVVTFPFVLLLFFWWRRASLAPSSTLPLTRRELLRVAPFFVLSLILGLVTMWFQHHRAIAEDVIREASLLTRFGDAGLAIWFYSYKAIFPVRLSFVYPAWELSARPVWSALAWLTLVFGFVLFWRKRWSWGRHLLFAIGYFVLMLLPALGFLNIYFHRYSLVADHWQYFALPGIIVLMVAAAAHFLSLRPKAQRWAMSAAGVCLVVLLGFCASRQAMTFKNAETLWRAALEKNPNAWLALNNLGLILEKQGKINEAIAHFEKSLRIKPDQIEGRNNLGNIRLDQRRLDEAMSYYQAAFQLNPNFATTRYNIANALDLQGKPDAALAEYREALRLNPGYVEAHNNLGCMLVLQGRSEEGMAHLREALRLQPDNLDSLHNLGRTLIAQGRPGEAVPLLRRAIQLQPDYLNGIYSLGDALLALGQRPEAFQVFSRALELNPDLPEAHYQMAVILSAKKNMGPAISHFQEAVRLKPDWLEPLNNLAWILATHTDENFRNGKRSVELAMRACALTGNKNSGALDTLAAAYAESGQFSDALATATTAEQIATSLGEQEMAAQILSRIELYRAGKPFRE